jgi:hypothetical protein
MPVCLAAGMLVRLLQLGVLVGAPFFCSCVAGHIGTMHRYKGILKRA